MRKSFYLPSLLVFCFILFSAAARAGVDPAITGQPVNDTVYVGSSANFNIVAHSLSGATMSYDWQVSTDAGTSWSDITSGATITSGVTTSSIAFPTSLSLSGNLYRCIVTNSVGSDTSSAAMLVVSVGLPPVIHTDPVNHTVFVGYPTSFSVTATDTPSFEAMGFEWQLSTDGGASWSSLTTSTGGTSSSYSIPVTSIGMDGNQYRAIVSNTAGNDTSAVATLTVLAGHPPMITTNPHDTAVCETAHPYFSVAANDTPGSLPLHYTWFSSPDGGATWDTVHNAAGLFSGAITDTLKLAPGALHTRSGYMFEVAVGSDSGIVYSLAATLIVDSVSAGTISGGHEICRGLVTTFSSTVASGVWTNLHHAIDTVDNAGNVYAISPGLDTLVYTVTNLCGVITSRYAIKVDTTLSSLPISGPDATCIGHFIDLTNPTAGGAWSSAAGVVSVDSTGRVTGLTQGSAIVSYTLSNVCNTTSATYFVNVDTAIDFGTITGDSVVCAGSWIHLTATAPGEGIWLSSNSAVAVTDFDGNVTGVSNGVATISYFFSNACGVAAATHVVTVSAVASHITGVDSVGVGFTRALFDSVGGGSWHSSDTTIAKINNLGVVTGIATGTATIVYSVTNTCGTSSDSIIIHVGVTNAGVITGPDTVCFHHTITLSDAVTGGVWSTLSDTVATVTPTGVVYGVNYGVSHITYTVSSGFGPKSIITSVFVRHIRVDSLHIPNIFSLGGYYTFYGYPAGGTWSNSNNAVGNFYGSPGFFVISGTGIDTVKYTVHNSCGTADTSFVINIPGGVHVGVNQLSNSVSAMNIYPNPSGGDFTVNISSNVTEEAFVVVTNMVGEKVKEITIQTNQPAGLKLDQPDGVYFLNAVTSTGKYSAKITITK